MIFFDQLKCARLSRRPDAIPAAAGAIRAGIRPAP